MALVVNSRQKTIFKWGAICSGIPLIALVLLSIGDKSFEELAGWIQSALVIVYLFAYFIAFPMFIIGCCLLLYGSAVLLWSFWKRKVNQYDR